MNLLVLSPDQVVQLADAPTLSPRLIDGGPEVGNSAVSLNVLTDRAQEEWWPILNTGRLVDLDLALAWPEPSDE